MNWEGCKINYTFDASDEADVGNLSKIKALLYHHLEYSTNRRLIGRLYMSQSQVYQKIKNYALAREAIKKAQKCFMELKDPSNLAVTYYCFGELLAREGKYPEALQKVYQGLPLLSEWRDDDIVLRGRLYTLAGKLLYEIGDYEEARASFQRSLQWAQEKNLPTEEATVLQGMAKTFLGMGQLQEAQTYYLLAIQRWKELGQNSEMAIVVRDLGYLYAQMGVNKKAISALVYCLKMLAHYSNCQLPEIKLKLAQIYLDMDIEKARNYCKQVMDYVLEDLAYRFTEKKEKLLARVFYMMGLYCKKKMDRKNMLLFFTESLKIYKKYRMEAHWNNVYRDYYKFAQPAEELSFNETNELISQLTGQDKFKLRSIVGQIS